MKKLLVWAVALAAGLVAQAYIGWTSNPGSAPSGIPYDISVEANGGAYEADLTIWKNGSWFASGNGPGWANASNSSTDYGVQTVYYTAEVSFDYGSNYESTDHYVSITQPNTAPSISWSQNPGSAAVNAWFVMEAHGNDPDGNLTEVNVWREWSPYAFGGGGNGYDSYWGGATYEGAVGSVTFMAQARDSNGATSGVITHTINIYAPNQSPSVSFALIPPSAWVNQTFYVQGKGNDMDGNLEWVFVWMNDQPFAFNAANGAESYTSSNPASIPSPNNPMFKAMAGDTGGLDSGFIYQAVTIYNHDPTNPTIAATVGGVPIANNGYMWLDESINLTATVHDDDGNLDTHAIYRQRVTGSAPDSGLWIAIDGDYAPSNGTNSLKVKNFTPDQIGRWDYHTNGRDNGGIWTGGASVTTYVYGSTNDAVFQSQTVPAMTTGDSFQVTISMSNAGNSNRPWINDSSPHQLKSITATNWGVSSVPLPGGTMVAPAPQTPNTATFVFNVTAPSIPGPYPFQWRMRENFPGNPADFGTPSTLLSITVVDNDPPGTPTLQLAGKTHNSVSLSWTAATDNSGTVSYRIYRNGSLAGSPSGLTFTDTGRTPNTAYSYVVKAFDGVNESPASNTVNVTTDLDPNADQDSDGIPNGYESANGLNPNSASDATLDLDGDGWSNIAEYNRGSAANVYNPGTSTLGNGIPGGWPLSDANPSQAVGATAGQLSVDKSGALSYSIPLWTTPGTAGLQPQLSLNYSSQGGAGPAGLGWSLGGVSAITRGPQSKMIDGQNKGVTLTADDRFYLDGQRLVLISGSEYRTELDSITKVVANGAAGSGPDSFTAWTKAGLIIQFGQTSDSAFDAWGKSEKLSWHVNRISDTKGNYMDFVYFEDAANGIHRLERINYTGNGGVAPYASVRFAYEDRPDTVSGYVAGSPVSSLKRLKYIRSYYGETVARTYTLDYTQAPLNDRSMLASLTEAGSDGKAYPPLTFDYETNVEGWDDGTAFLPPYYLADNSNSGRPAGSGFVDLDGDGRTDFVARRDNNGSPIVNLAYRNTGSGWTADTNFNLPYPMAENENTDDQGSRFADLNGDGLVDYIYRKYDYSGIESNQAWLNTGTGWTPSGNWNAPALIYRDGTVNDYPLRGGKFLDVNADGRVDFVSHLNGPGGLVNLAVYLNNGNGWDAQHANYSSLPGFSGSNLPKYKPRFIDLNGDGLPDIAVRYEYGGDALDKVWLNNGNGWTESISYRLPKTIANDTNPGPGAEFADVNGDGLPDLVWYRELSGGGQQRGVALNTGAGWNVPADGTDLYNRHAPPQPLSRDNWVNAGSAFLDLNADGITDYIFSRQFSGQGAQKAIYYGRLKDWNYAGLSAVHELPHLLLQEGVTQTGADFVDFNGDGAVDVVWKRKHADNSDFADVRLNRARPIHGRLKKVTNGFGIAVDVTYASLMDPQVYTKAANNSDLPFADQAKVVNLIGPMFVVRSVVNDNGAGGTHSLVYSYASLRAHLDRGSLGFGWMKVHDTARDIRTQTTFRQDYPFTGQAACTKVTRVNDAGPLLSESTATWAEKLLNTGAAYPTRLLYASTVEEKSYDLGTQTNYLTTTTTTAQPDDYGNITSMTVSTSDGFGKTTSSAYLPADTTNWILGRLQTSSVISAAPNGEPSVTRNSSFTYNSAGLLETETVQPGDAVLALTTTYGYDQFGNKISVSVSGPSLTVDNNGNYSASGTATRTTTSAYDTNGRFPDYTSNATGHTEDYGYDQVRGVVTTLVGANDLTTTWTYDGFGRKTGESRADGTQSTIGYRWTPGGSLADSKYFIESESTGTAPARTHHDRFGRARWSQSINGTGKIVLQETRYDAFSRASQTSVPYFNDGSPVWWSGTSSFDSLDRPLSTYTPDDENSTQTVSYGYNGFTAIATDPKNRVSETVKNSQGWTLSNIRNRDAGAGALDYSAVTYTYDALGNLKSTNAAGVTTTLAYDLRGRKETMTDADMGTWLYRYNAFGELIWQKDAKAQIVRLSYDNLGRLIQRIEPEGTTIWTYDTSPTKGLGKLHTVSSPGGYAETYTYDSLGRPAQMQRTIDGAGYSFDNTYDASGRPLKTEYPTVNGGRFATRNVYNDYGYLKEIRSYLTTDDGKPNSQLQGKVWWMADSYHVSGRVDGESYGNGLAGDRVYSAATGRLRMASIDRGSVATAPYAIQQMVYTYDQVGNVLTRADQAVGRGESFGYDGLDRLLTHTVVTGVGGTVSVAYDQKGNIVSKSDVGTYSYDPTKQHALTGVSGGPLGAQSYTYDANGNMLSGGGRTMTWTSFNQAASIVKGSYSSTFSFGASHERVKQVSHLETTIYVGGLFEKVTPVGGGAVTEFKHYIMAPTGRVAVYTDRSNLVRDARYFHTDGLGSITAVSDEKGAIVKRFAFDAWGKRLDPATGATITGATAASFRRGYTDHEQMDDLGLVHMNGRVYDAVLGRFLSADTHVDGASDAQGFNRYSYVGNNPINATDPSGYFSWRKFLGVGLFGLEYLIAPKFFNQYGGQALGIAVTAVVTWWTGSPTLGGAAGGFVSGFTSSLLNGGNVGDAFKSGVVGGVIGGVMGAVTGGIHTAFGPVGTNVAVELGRAAAHGVAGGLLSEATGGEFQHGFLAGFAGSIGGSLAPHIPGVPGYNVRTFSAIAARTTIAAVVGGTASVLGGGKFANGAITAAFQHLLNHEGENIAGLRQQDKYKMFALYNKDSKTAGMRHGHIAALLEVPDSDGGYLYFNFDQATDPNLTILGFTSLEAAKSSSLLSKYDFALEFQTTKAGGFAAIEVGGSYGNKGYWPTASILGSNCAEMIGAIMLAGGVSGWEFSWRPSKSYEANKGRAIQNLKWGTH